MPRLVHLAPASRLRAIERAGIRGGRAAVLEASGHAEVERAVFAMPLMLDFSITHQWLRELRRCHGERMIAVHFRLSSDEEILVGRYNAAHARLPLRDAIRRLLEDPLGNELIVTRSIARREVTRIREVTQLVGWTETPEKRAAFDCLCRACVPAGTRDLMRRVRGAFERHLTDARKAPSNRAVVEALRCLDTVLERANGRIAPDKLLGYAKSRDPDVRRIATSLFGLFRWAQVESVLVKLLSDSDARVRKAAVESLVQSGGVRRAYPHVVAAGKAAIALFVDEHLRFERDVKLASVLLAALAPRADVTAVARAMLEDDDVDAATRERLELLADEHEGDLNLLDLARGREGPRL